MNSSNSRVSRPLREARGSSSSRGRVECESRAGRVRVGCGSRLVLATLAVICTVCTYVRAYRESDIFMK